MKKNCVFESDILHILLADSIISTAKRFQEMKKLQFLKEKEEDLLMFLLKLVGKVVAAPFCLIEELRNRLAMFIVS